MYVVAVKKTPKTAVAAVATATLSVIGSFLKLSKEVRTKV